MTKGVAWLQDNSLRRELLKLLRAWCWSEREGELEGEDSLDVHDVLLTERGRFLVGEMIGHAIEYYSPNAIALATVKVSDDCLALAIMNQMVGTYRSRERGSIRFRVLNVFFESRVSSTRYLEELLDLRPGDEVVLVVDVVRDSLVVLIRAAVERIRSHGLVVTRCLALVNDLEDDVDLKVELVSIYARADFEL